MKKQSILQQIFAPVQQWLLEQGKCAHCGQSLAKGKKEMTREGEVVICRCGQAYFYLPQANLYKKLLLKTHYEN